MSQFRYTLVFRPQLASAPGGPFSTAGSTYSWTESWYSTTQESLADAKVRARFMVDKRTDWLSTGWAITQARLAVYPATRATGTVRFNAVDGGGNIGGAAGPGGPDEQPYDALIINCNGLSGARSFEARGIPRNVVSPSGDYLAPAFFTDPFNSWAAWMLAGNFALRVVTPGTKHVINNILISGTPPAEGSPVQPIALLDSGGGDPILGDTVRISGVLGMGGANGVWHVAKVVDPLTVGGFPYRGVFLRQKRGRSVVGVYFDGGFLTTQVYNLVNILSFTPNEGSTRKTGSGPFRHRGRRSTRAS